MKIFSGLKARKLTRAIENQPDVFKHYQELIQYHQTNNNLDEAKKSIDRARERNWNNAENAWLIIQLEIIQQKLNHYDDGVFHLVSDVYKNVSLQPELRLEAALAATAHMKKLNQGSQELKTALPAFESILELAPNHPRSIELMLISADIEVSDARYISAAKHLETALDTAARHRIDGIGKLYLQAAEINMKTGLDTAKTKKWLVNALETDDLSDAESIRALTGIADINRREDDFLGAMERYETALRFAGSRRDAFIANIRFQLAQVNYSLGRAAQAEKEAAQAVDTPELPKDKKTEILMWIADIKHASGRTTEALQILKQALEITQKGELHAKLLQKQAELLEATGSFSEAIQSVEKALEQETESSARLLFQLARLHNLEGSHHKTLKLLKQIAQTPDLNAEISNDSIMLETGRAYLGQQKIIRALETFIQILQQAKPDSATFQETRKQLASLKKELLRPEGMKKFKLDGTDKKTIESLLGRIPDEEDFLARLRSGLKKTRSSLIAGIEKILVGRSTIDDSVLDEIEELMILSDLGVETTGSIIKSLREKLLKKELNDAEVVRNTIRTEIEGFLSGHASQLEPPEDIKPFIIMVVGVNGVGKTTTIAKIARRFQEQGRSVLLAAGDTFRAGAIEQLKEWGRRLEIDVVAHGEGADPSAVAWDAVAAARSRKCDILIIDTAGRLHTKSNLMEELKKVQRVIDKNMPGAPHEILLVLDATTGQNAVVQARQFAQTVNITGIVLTKLDGTAKGGIIVSIVQDLDIPIKLIGIGERMDDLRNFDPPLFAKALFEDNDSLLAADDIQT